jgi:transcriptional regulator with PAS, ATPase and Fis domain
MLYSRRRRYKMKRKDQGCEIDNIPELVLDNLPIGIIFCDTTCNIRFINHTYAQYLGVDQHQVIGKPITDYIPESRLNTVLKTGQAELRDKCHVGEGENKRVLIVNRIPVVGGKGIVGVISQSLFGDLGELKELSERIDMLEKKVSTYREKIKSALSAKHSIDSIKGQSACIFKAKELVSRYAKTDSPVLLMGATGTGKELFAHALHLKSQRSQGPFVSINCAAIPYDLFESELFGYAQGAFTGAQKEGKMGQLELADKGTLFLDEIGDMPLQAQVKLFRVLEEKILYRLGCTRPKKVDFRLIAATNRDIKAMIHEGKFREELYYRLNTMIVAIPPLRERREDIPVLVRHILDSLHKQTISCSDEAMHALIRYDWPGNVRELKNVIERALSLCNGNSIGMCDLPTEIASECTFPLRHESLSSDFPLSTSLAKSEQKLIREALTKNNWNVVKTAKMLSVSRAALYEKIKKYRIYRPRKLPHDLDNSDVLADREVVK